MADEGGEKTEEPTDKKIQDSRKRGMVWKSKDLTGVAVFLVGLAAIKATWPNTQGEITKLFDFGFDRLAHPVDLERAIYAIMLMAVIKVVLITLPAAGGAALVGGLVEFLQVGPLFSNEVLIPKLEKLNPVEGFKNLFSKKQIVELIKSTAKILIAGYVVYGAVRDSIALVAQTVNGDGALSMAVLGELVYRIAVRVGLLFLLFAVFDVWWQRRVYMKELMMTKEEVKREYKESEGDPHHKAKRKEMHQEILEGAMMESVKEADVVVTNPDHLAIALQYHPDQDGAPRIIAKGIDASAEAIKAVAKAADVPMMRNVPLAHALLPLDLGTEVPEPLYDAVAEVLNFVYGLQGL